MSKRLTSLKAALASRFADQLTSLVLDKAEITIEVKAEDLLEVCTALRDEQAFKFEQCMDVCGVDYSTYGDVEWDVGASGTGFSRGREDGHDEDVVCDKPRYAVVYHLLSVCNNQRLRVRTFAFEPVPVVPSVLDIWNGVDWFEREAFDLYGILFDGHPDLRRILTDYGFVGHPFRKDFPLIGQVEMRYDATEKRCVYEPVSIEPRVLVPRVIRSDKDEAPEQAVGDTNG